MYFTFRILLHLLYTSICIRTQAIPDAGHVNTIGESVIVRVAVPQREQREPHVLSVAH